MARYPLNLPVQLKKEAEEWASSQGISLNQFILWAVSENEDFREWAGEDFDPEDVDLFEINEALENL